MRHRLKDRISLARKVLSDIKYSSLVDLSDVIGIRVITYFADEVDVVASIIRREFKVESENDKRAEHLPGEFGYRSLHQVVRLNPARSDLLEYRTFEKLTAEIQIRSILDHAWAEIEHDRAYKGSALIPTSIQEQFAELAALLRNADRQFENVRNELEEHASTKIWGIARAEGITELLGDFIIDTNKGRFPLGSQSLRWDLLVYLNTNVTNRVGHNNLTDVIAFLDGATLSRPASKSSNNTLVFERALCLDTIEKNEFRIRVANVRANALSFGSAAPIKASLEARSRDSGDRVILADALEVGHTRPSMSFRVIDHNGDEKPLLLARAPGINSALAEDPKANGGIVNFELCFREAINGAFRTDLQEAGSRSTAADSGTRLAVYFSGVPDNVEIYVTAREIPAAPHDSRCKARLIETDWRGSGFSIPMKTLTEATIKRTHDIVPIARLQKSRLRMAVWEWVDGDPYRITPEEVRFGVVVAAKPGTAGPGTARVIGHFDPVSTVQTASSSSPIPRFGSTGPSLEAFSFLQ